MRSPSCIEDALVIEIADGWSAGAVTGRLLSELGARVLKLEPPEGDRLRHIGPGANGKNSTSFRTLNTNKESISLDIGAVAGHQTLDALLAKSDVLLTDQTTITDRALCGNAIDGRQTGLYKRQPCVPASLLYEDGSNCQVICNP